jgi:aspartate/methionine/tyrosine aminotransferase
MPESKSIQNQMTYFQMRPVKSAKVSEISEATAASPVKPEERVNFHIGNPVQDEFLNSFYRRLVLGFDISPEQLGENSSKQIIKNVGWEDNQVDQVRLICETIKNSVPYMPQGGFSRTNPNKLALYVKDWLSEQQAEPLFYDLGVESGKREIIFASGGKWEDLRIFFYSIANYLVKLPAKVISLNFELPAHLLNFPNLEFKHLFAKEDHIISRLKEQISALDVKPTFLLMDQVVPEAVRRELRFLSQQFPLFFIELNNILNPFSIAREAGMLNNVIRFLSPAALNPNLSEIAVSIVVGNSEILKVFRKVHFELKGTPSASEIDLLTYLLEQKLPTGKSEIKDWNNSSNKTDFPFSGDPQYLQTINQRASNLENNIEKRASTIVSKVENVTYRINQISENIQNSLSVSTVNFDPFSGISTCQIVKKFIDKIHEVSIHKDLEQAFLSAFLKLHPEYSGKDCLVVSGSNRSALGFLGYHCGITDAIIPDLSWTYEHCFPNVITVPLTNKLSLDKDAIINAVKRKIEKNHHWQKSGAVILNNPHNASGSVFDEKTIIELLKWLLENKIFVIDDLAYENVAPTDEFTGSKTLRQIVNNLIKIGQLRNSQAKYLLTVNALSKTDCFAGARLAVIEILHPALKKKYSEINSTVQQNSMAILLAYLFYRNHNEAVKAYWKHRNTIFKDRMDAIEKACEELPADRNPFDIKIQRPAGAMYPKMVIDKLPHGISLDWLASGLATQGIGLVPLTTFARSAKGFDLARKTFRLSLGGTDNAESLLRKTRRVLIDLNRLIAQESAQYRREKFPVTNSVVSHAKYFIGASENFNEVLTKAHTLAINQIEKRLKLLSLNLLDQNLHLIFREEFAIERFSVFRQRFQDRLQLSERIIAEVGDRKKSRLIDVLENEFYKESLAQRKKRFRQRLFDRTVHPTQMFSLTVDLQVEKIIETILQERIVSEIELERFASELVDEFLGKNVSIQSAEEADELVLDLKLMIESEDWTQWNYNKNLSFLFSFWGDWDGSTRPSGQGHRLVAGVLLENVKQQAHLLKTLLKVNRNIRIDTDIYSELQKLDTGIQKFWNLLNEITSLTNHLEKRYLSVLPFNVRTGIWRKLGMKLHLAQDRMTALWHHNDRLERKMQHLRDQRRQNLEYYFSLNKKLRKVMFENLPYFQENSNNPELALLSGSYRNLLNRFVLTPRIHQKMVVSSDQFAIDTTVHNIMELNEISGKYNNPGMVMALQISMTTEPEALISLDRKLRTRREEILRKNPDANVPSVWLVPLFEDENSIKNLDKYLDRLWEYAVQSRRLAQPTRERFSEMICELFFAGSDLSQQVSQPAGAALYRDAKYKAIKWLAQHDLIDQVRIKLGSGEPMQRQGGFYDEFSGAPLFLTSKNAHQHLKAISKESARRSVDFACSPLRGVFAGGEFRTFQSNLAEHLRRLSIQNRADLLYHVSKIQKFHQNELLRVYEPLKETRLQFQKRGWKELERLTLGDVDEAQNEFIALVKKNFQQILYGQEEDVVGIHVISYFISRTTPTFRDRPTVRPSRDMGQKGGQQVVERLAQTLPLFKHGSLLRAIGHNRAQTMILGINQLTTGLFRALSEFAAKQYQGTDGKALINERILPTLPVHDILHTLRIYQDQNLQYLNELETAFPAGNSALLALREDNDSIYQFIGLLQKELLKRQGLDVTNFFVDDNIIVELLPAMRPDVAVLLQPDLFNTDIKQLIRGNRKKIDESWLEEMERFMLLPRQVASWRQEIWTLIKQPIRQQVESFVELAMAIHSLSSNNGGSNIPLTIEPTKILRVGSQVSKLLRGDVDDSMRQFLLASVQYLTEVPNLMSEVPIDVLRALQDVERIVQIEQQALGKKEQDLLRFYILKIARLCGENG